eukprot:c39029_g1_i1 orf=86-238(+)
MIGSFCVLHDPQFLFKRHNEQHRCAFGLKQDKACVLELNDMGFQKCNSKV